MATELVAKRWLTARRGSVALELKLLAARLVRRLDRIRGDGNADLARPGRLLLKLQPDCIRLLARRIPNGTVVVSATNGKTTTVAMLAAVAAHAGLKPVYSPTGQNMANGVAAELAAFSRVPRRIKGDLGVFEADELWFGGLVRLLEPRFVVLGNLFRDQLDRFGELDRIAAHWRTVVTDLPPSCRIIACADDPLVAEIAAMRDDTLFFGIDDQSVKARVAVHASDSTTCRRCGEAYRYDGVYLGHMGRYWCDHCGQGRPRLGVAGEAITARADGMTFVLRSGDRRIRIQLPLNGMHNVYNAVAASTVAIALGLPLPETARALRGFVPVFGRGEIIDAKGKSVKLLLVKNPAAADAVIDSMIGSTSKTSSTELDLLIALNDAQLDTHDESWIWDAGYEALAASTRRAVCTGNRAAEMGLRLKYAGITPDRITVAPDIADAVDAALSLGPGPLVALANYSAMLKLRGVLVQRGYAENHWRGDHWRRPGG